MTARQYLMEVIKLKEKIRNLSEDLDALRTKAEGLKAITYDKDRVQTSPSDQMPDYAIRLVQIRNEMERDIVECYDMIRDREDMISRVNSPKQREVLRWRYIRDNDGRQYYFSEIAEKMDVLNPSSVINLHKRALKSFRKVYDGNTMKHQ